MKRFIYTITIFVVLTITFASCKKDVETIEIIKILLNKRELRILAAEEETLTATILPTRASNRNLNWQSDNTDVATVNDNGKVTAIAEGTAVITVAAQDGSGVTEKCTVTVLFNNNIPAITTLPVENITNSSATLGGNITFAGNPAYTERGICYSTSRNPTTSSNKIVIPGSGTGNFTTEVTGLSQDITYYVRAYSINSIATVYGAEISFTTSGNLPAITTLPIENITNNSAKLGGSITFAGNPAYTERGVCYSTSPTPTTGSNKIMIPGSGTGSFTTEATGLSENITYYVRAYAINLEGTAYGNELRFKINSLGIQMVAVQGGSFTMGCTGEQGGECWDYEYPAHQVTLSSYQISKHQITQKQWQEVMGNNPSYFSGCDNCPVEQVSWNDIVGTSGNYTELNGIRYYENGFIYKLNQLTGMKYRLPTEAEWEFAARGGNQSNYYKYSGSNNIDEVAWYASNSNNRTHDVGTKMANELGIYDMSGNVYEWCSDWSGYYGSSSQTNPTGPTTGSYRVLRGGSWGYGAFDCRVSHRGSNPPDSRSRDFGFRVAVAL